MNLPQVEVDVKAVSHMMRARLPILEERSEDQGPPVDAGPTFMGAVPWRMYTADLLPDEVLLDSGGAVLVTDPCYYEDEVLFPSMIYHWFRNREQDWHWRGKSPWQAC